MGHQAHYFHKRLRDKNTVERIVTVCGQIFNCKCVLHLDGQPSIPGFRKIAPHKSSQSRNPERSHPTGCYCPIGARLAKCANRPLRPFTCLTMSVSTKRYACSATVSYAASFQMRQDALKMKPHEYFPSPISRINAVPCALFRTGTYVSQVGGASIGAAQ